MRLSLELHIQCVTGYLQTAVLPSPCQHLQQRRSELVQAKEVGEHHTVHGCQLTPTCKHAHTHTHSQKRLKGGPVDNSIFQSLSRAPTQTSLLSHKSFFSFHVIDNMKTLGQNKHADDRIEGKVKQRQNN